VSIDITEVTDDTREAWVRDAERFYAEAAGKGAAWLDEVSEGWPNRIDTSELRLSDATCCVLGQLRQKDAGLMNEVRALSAHGHPFSTEYGFEVVDEPDDDGLPPWVDTIPTPQQYSILTEAWLREIDRRLHPLGSAPTRTSELGG
jgi:hypothetical protein